MASQGSGAPRIELEQRYVVMEIQSNAMPGLGFPSVGNVVFADDEDGAVRIMKEWRGKAPGFVRIIGFLVTEAVQYRGEAAATEGSAP